MDFSATSSSSSSSSSSSFSWTAPGDAATEPSNDESDVHSTIGGRGIDADAERKKLAAVRDFKRKTLRALEQEKEKLDEWVEVERRKKASDEKSDIEKMRARLEEIRADFVTLRMLSSFKVDLSKASSQET